METIPKPVSTKESVQPVTVETVESTPIPMPEPVKTYVETLSIPPVVTSEPKEALFPTTTFEEQRHAASQRQVNMIWEYTQAAMALGMLVSFIYCAIYKIDSPLLNGAFFTVIGFYFGRTNHQNVGGVQLGR